VCYLVLDDETAASALEAALTALDLSGVNERGPLVSAGGA